MKKLLSVLLSASILFSLTACSQPAQPSSSTPSAPSEVSSSAPSADPAPSSQPDAAPVGAVTVTDHLKREVTFEQPAEKIVSGYYITSSLLIALGLDDKVVGIEEKAASRPIYGLAAADFLELPNVGSAKNFNLEACVALKPDLVILPIRLKDTVTTLEDMGIKVLAVNPEDEISLYETITMIATVTGTTDKGDALIKYTEQKKAEMDTRNKLKSTDVPTVYVAGNSDYLSTATAKMYQSSMVAIAGGKNVADDIDDTYWATISPEQLIAYNPDMIVIVPFAAYTKDDILKDSKLATLDAVKNGAVYQMPTAFEAWDSPVPSSILGSMWLHGIINEGNGYDFATFQEDAAGFYQTFYDITIKKDDLTK